MKFDESTEILSAIADIQTGPFGSQLHKDDYVDMGTPIVTVEHLGRRKFTLQNLPCVSNKDAVRLSKYVMRYGDTIFSRVGSVDRCSFASSLNDGWLFSGRCLRIRPRNNVHPLYLYYYLNSDKIKKYIRNIAVGATMPSINTKLMGEIPCSLPSIEIQYKIGKFLSDIDDKIEQNEMINKNLEDQAQAIFKAWFIDFEPFGGGMPRDWRMGIAGEILEFHDAKRVPLSGSEREKMDKIYPYYGATSLMDYVDNYIFEGIYLLLGEDGTVITKDGFPVLQYVDGKFWVNNHAHILTGKLGFSVEELYLLFSLTNIKSIVTGAVQPKVSQTNLKKVTVVIPPMHILKEFDGVIQPMFEDIRNRRAENERLTAIRDTLLPRLMSGEIDVSNIEV